MREIVLDTETTGLDPREGHRIIEIGCVELLNKTRTGKVFHKYINPERDVPKSAEDVHGISTEFLKDKPKFNLVAKEFIEFIGNDRLVIHNAQFDMKFLNFELEQAGFSNLSFDRALDTLILARAKFPGQKASLDALCSRFNISLEKREKHGALLDAELLSDVYIELIGGAQGTIAFEASSAVQTMDRNIKRGGKLEPRPHEPTAEELELHATFLKKIKNPRWTN